MSKLAEIKERESKATEGPWTLVVDMEGAEEGSGVGASIYIPEINRMLRSSERADPDEWDADLANAEFIAHARYDIPYLLAHLDMALAMLGLVESPDIPVLINELKVCKKCGGKDVHLAFHRGDHKDCSYNAHNKSSKEHLHYFCRLCGYDWTGPTLDAEEGNGS